jgi:hypothetical protein
MLKASQWLLVVVLLSGLGGEARASDNKKDEADFVALLKILPGDYDNLAQTESEEGGKHAAVVLSIKPLNVQTVGKLVMYVRETAADDPRRLLAQRIWTLERDKQHHFVQRVYMFKEPQRWIHAGDDPLLMQSLLPDDISQLVGCEVLWTKTDTAFVGAIRSQGCRAASSAGGVLIETGAELNGDDLTMNEQQPGPGGRVSADADPAQAYHFQRRGG